MKISDDNLIEKIWLNQLRKLSTGVLHNFAGGGVRLIDNDSYWYASASAEYRCNRKNVTDEIKPQQLLARLRKLAATGRIKFQNETSFFIDSDKARSAFISARNFYIDSGILEGEIGVAIDKDVASSVCLNRLQAQYA